MREHTKTDERSSAADLIDRRSVLKASAAATVGGLGVTAATGTVAADGPAGELLACGSGWQNAPANYPTIDLTQSSPSTTGDFPEGADEFVVYVHGWLEQFAGTGEDQGYTLEVALEQNNYTRPTATAIWDSNQPWFQAKRNADEAGRRLAQFFNDYLDTYPNTTIHTVDHSLGARVILVALNNLSGDKKLDDVSLMGAAVDPDTVCEGAEYASGIENNAGEVYSYYSNNDGAVCSAYLAREGTEGLGCDGAKCGLFGGVGGLGSSTPSNYTDVDVSNEIQDHCNYGKPDVGIVGQIEDNF